MTPVPDLTPTPDTLRAAIERLAADYATDETEEFTGGGVAAALRAALAAPPAPTDTPDERCPVTTSDHPHALRCTWDVGHFGRCIFGPEDDRSAAVTAPREDDFTAYRAIRDALATVHRTVTLPQDAEPLAETIDQVLRRAAPPVERATPDPDTLAALIERTYEARTGRALNYLDAIDITRDLIAAGVTLNQPAPNQLTPDTAVRTLAGQLLDLIAGLVVNSPDELIDFCNDAARHLVSTGVTIQAPA